MFWKNRLNNLDFLPIQTVRQYNFHDVAKYKKISPKESVDIKEFRPEQSGPQPELDIKFPAISFANRLNQNIGLTA